MTYELNEQYQPIRKYLTGVGILRGDSITGCFAKPQQSDAIDDYEGHLEYSEITDWYPHLFYPEYNQPWYSYMKDQVGTIYKVHSLKTRSIEDSRAYDTFGNLVSQTGTTKTPLGFQGKYYDAESGLNYFYHRYYNPTIGRFTSEDPVDIKGGLNLFNFVGGNPVKFTDKFGFESDWRDQMQNGGGWSQVNNNEFTALFGASPAEMIGWTTTGMIKSLLNAATGKGCPCEKAFWDCMRNELVVPGWGDVWQTTADATGSFMHAFSWVYAAVNNLSTPFCSDIFRFNFYGGKNLGPTFAAGYFAYASWKCLFEEIKCLKNQ